VAGIKRINAENFKPFGRIIDCPTELRKDRENNLFYIVVSETQNVGWRIAYLVTRDKTINKLEKHPDTFESFEPVTGKTLIYVANDMNPDAIECFYLDRPVVLKKGIWHGVTTLGEESEVKITENASVECVFWPLGFPLGAQALSLSLFQ
jgi:ureidoglycolate hydrolase